MRPTNGCLAGILALATAMGYAADRTPTPHPQAAPLPFTHSGDRLRISISRARIVRKTP